MPDYVRFGLVGMIILITHFQEGITGFGCTALALPFVLLLLGLDVAVPSLCILAWFLSLFIVIVARKDIVWREYWHILLPTSVGLAFGILMRDALPDDWLKWILAVFMFGIGIRGTLLKPGNVRPKTGMSKTNRILLSGFLPAGGVIQGAFASGGPLLVIYATKALPGKGVFRVTLCMVWVTINGLLIGQWAVRGMITPDILKIVAIGVPFSLVGMVIGNWAHHRVDEYVFRRIVYTVLMISGLMLAYPLIR